MKIIDYLDKPDYVWHIKLPKSERYPRHWKVIVDMDIELSDGRRLVIKEGFVFDGASIPKWLWWLFKPMDDGALGDVIHDKLWVDKVKEISHFDGSIFEARKYSENNRLEYRKSHAPDKKIKNYVTHYFLRWFGGLWYSKQIKIPN